MTRTPNEIVLMLHDLERKADHLIAQEGLDLPKSDHNKPLEDRLAALETVVVETVKARKAK